MTDANGNITTCTWMDDNQLAAVALPNSGGTVTNAYDGDGLRFSRTNANGTNSFAWNGKVLDTQLGAGNTVSTWYTQGMGEYGDIISTRDASAGASSLQLYDASGNVNQTTDAGANITAGLAQPSHFAWFLWPKKYLSGRGGSARPYFSAKLCWYRPTFNAGSFYFFRLLRYWSTCLSVLLVTRKTVKFTPLIG